MSKKKVKNKKKNLGIESEKDEFSEWYSQAIIKAHIVDYSPISGCMIFKPFGYKIWEIIKEQTDKRFKKIGIKNVYFPLFIPESLLKKEAKPYSLKTSLKSKE